MWQVYQYAHGKLKLTKDLKTAESHLRVSLIDQQEIENMGKIYKDRKNYYKINSELFTAPAFVQQKKDEDTTVHLSYKQKVQLYRRRVQNEKLDNKYNNLFKKTEKRRHKMRNPILYKMLQQFEEEYKHEDNLQIRDDLKESEKNLEMIKINTNRRVKFDTTTEEAAPNRPRFISLESSKPQKEGQHLPKWIDYLEGRMAKPSKATSGINISELQNTFESIISKNAAVKTNKTRKSSKQHANPIEFHSPCRSQETGFRLTNLDVVEDNEPQKNFVCDRCERSCQQKKKDDDKEQTHLHRNLSSNRQTEARKTMNKYFKRNSSKPQQNIAVLAERTFSKSENYSKNVISTMGNFYQTKNHKKEDYQKMVFYLKKDRPLTSNIRRSNYRVISAGNIQQINKYRSMSQKERLNLKNKNHDFYLSLLRQLEGHNVEEMTLTGKIMDRLRKVLSQNYIISHKHLEYISQPALYQSRDEMSETILKQSQQFIHKQQQ